MKQLRKNRELPMKITELADIIREISVGDEKGQQRG